MKTRLVCLILALGSAVMATAAEPLKITISGFAPTRDAYCG